MKPTTSPRYALVTGGASGLGRAFCLELARRGWHVAVADIDQPGAESTVAMLVAQTARTQVEHLDVADMASWESLLERLRVRWPRLDLLINNAGVCGAGPMGEYPWEDFRRIIDVNLMGVIHGCHVCLPWLRETAPGGHIVNIASLAANISPPTMAAYNVSKSGIVGLSETLYGELYDIGIGVTIVMPGFFATRLLENGRFHDELLRKLAEDRTQAAEFTAEDVVAQTLRAVERRQLYVILGRSSRAVSRLKRLAPSWVLRMVAKTFARDLAKARSIIQNDPN